MSSATLSEPCASQDHPATQQPLASPLALSGRLPAIDGLRGLAILLVTAYRFNLGPECESWLGRLLFKPLYHGDIGVDLFFVLSGFLITGVLYDAKGKPNYFRNFFMRRSLRIFPLYFGVLFVALWLTPRIVGTAAAPFADARAEQAWLWTYLANFLLGLRGDWALGAFSHFWSLSAEEHFYLVWPLVVYFCARRHAMTICLLAIAGSMLGRLGWIAFGGNLVAAETFTFFRLEGLGLGAFLALLGRGPNGLEPLARRWRAGLAIATIALVATWALHWHPTLIAYSILAALFGCLLVLALGSEPTGRWGRLWRSAPLGFFGRHSYAIYVFQKPLVVLLMPLLSPEALCERFDSVLLGRLAYLGVMFALTTGLAVMSWHLFERRILELKRFFPTSRAGQGVSASTRWLPLYRFARTGGNFASPAN
jgi:peptidoglycan/LPS O-acetylase OafA/YrhL